MSCYSCGSTFGLFKKEQGCKNCGYSFCKDCLSKKAAIPKLNNERHKVCLKCYKILSGEMQPNISTKQYSPPEAYTKRMAKLENASPVQPEQKIQNTGSHSKVPPQFKNMSKEDVAIAQRLQKLKEDTDKKVVPSQTEMEERLKNLKKEPNGPPPSEEEMAARLARLKGQDANNVSKPQTLPTERRPQTQQVDDLLQEICNEVEIDSHGLDYVADVQNRLDQFRGSCEKEKPGDVENNLNTPNSKDQFTYIKNIPQVDKKFESASGEAVGWTDVNQLINQVAGELDLDAHKAIAGLKKDNELWERLNKLKQKKKSNVQEEEERKEINTSETARQPTSDEDVVENEEEACKNIIKQLLEESQVEDALEEEELIRGKLQHTPAANRDSPSRQGKTRAVESQPEDADTEELPWCCICNNDASLRCLGCDGDLYCKRCYKEGHDREDYSDHQTKPFKPPTKQ